MQTSIIDVDAGMKLLCDPAHESYLRMQDKLSAFRTDLDEHERRYLDTMMSAAAVAVADHGPPLLEHVEQFERDLASRLELTDEEAMAPVATGFFCVATIRFNCATRLFRC